MGNKLFIGGLPYTTTQEQLLEMFSEFGAVSEAVVITDRFTGRSKGFGFVTFESEKDVQAALSMNGKDIGGRSIIVNEARPRD